MNKKKRPGYEPVQITKDEVQTMRRIGIFYYSSDPESPYYLNQELRHYLLSIYRSFDDVEFVEKYLRKYIAQAIPCCISTVEHFLTKFIYKCKLCPDIAYAYKSHVFCYRRKNGTDYFQRGRYKILYRYKNKLYPTTVQQCNAIVFMHMVNLLDIMEEHMSEIEKDMKRSKAYKQQLKKQGKHKRISYQPCDPPVTVFA